MVVSLHVPKNDSENFELLLSDGQVIKAHHLMIGTGRIPKIRNAIESPLQPKYVGFKAHFEGISLENSIEMHTFDGGYLGISNIDNKTTNIACIEEKSICRKLTPTNYL